MSFMRPNRSEEEIKEDEKKIALALAELEKIALEKKSKAEKAKSEASAQQQQGNSISPAVVEQKQSPQQIEGTSVLQSPKKAGPMKFAERLLSEDSLEKVIKKLGTDWSIDVDVKGAGAGQYKSVTNKDGKNEFQIHLNNITTQSNNVETFTAMLKTYQATHSDSDIPVITTDNSEAAKLWEKALKDVYPGIANPAANIVDKEKEAKEAKAAEQKQQNSIEKQPPAAEKKEAEVTPERSGPAPP